VTEKDQQDILKNWLNQYSRLVFKIVRAYAMTAMDRDDLFQEIIIQIWRSIPAFRQESAVSTWIYRIALNTSINWLRKERKQLAADALDDVHHVLQEIKVPEDERLTWLYEEIYKLDKIDRSITLLLLDDFSYKEMASILGITESNVGVKINRIKKLLIGKSKNMNYEKV
jgi:RNA polymerase sigma-70 factor (ECF subfamily)